MESITTLIVDDERSFRKIVSQRLRQRGITASAVSSGPEALQRLAQAHRIAVVVLDLKMPVMDGIETLRSIKKTFPMVEVVMLTGHATIDSAIEAMKSGAFDYLAKPFDIDQLVEIIIAAAVKKRNRDAKIRDIRARPYISEREREKLIFEIMKK
ncbi:MAG: response regulator [Desulfobacterales bacterium]